MRREAAREQFREGNHDLFGVPKGGREDGEELILKIYPFHGVLSGVSSFFWIAEISENS